MAKAKEAAKAAKVAKVAGNPSLGGVPWVEPYPEAVLDDDGKDTVFVRAIPTQDIRINGHVLRAGIETTLPCSVAHAHGAALAAPASLE